MWLFLPFFPILVLGLFPVVSTHAMGVMGAGLFAATSVTFIGLTVLRSLRSKERQGSTVALRQNLIFMAVAGAMTLSLAASVGHWPSLTESTKMIGIASVAVVAVLAFAGWLIARSDCGPMPASSD